MGEGTFENHGQSMASVVEKGLEPNNTIEVSRSDGKKWEYQRLPGDFFENDQIVAAVLRKKDPPDVSKISPQLVSMIDQAGKVGQTMKKELMKVVTLSPDNVPYLLTTTLVGNRLKVGGVRTVGMQVLPQGHREFINIHNHPMDVEISEGEGFSHGDFEYRSSRHALMSLHKPPLISAVACEGGNYLAVEKAAKRNLFNFMEKAIDFFSQSEEGKRMTYSLAYDYNALMSRRETKTLQTEIPTLWEKIKKKMFKDVKVTGSTNKERLQFQKILAESRGIRIYFINHGDDTAYRIV